MATVTMTADSFEQTIDNNSIVLIDFWAGWCGPCKAFAPVFEEASNKHPDITFAKVDTEAEEQLAAEFQIHSIPTLAVFRDQVLLFMEAGALPAKGLDELITQVRALDMDAVREEMAKHQHEHGCCGGGHDHDHDHEAEDGEDHKGGGCCGGGGCRNKD